MRTPWKKRLFKFSKKLVATLNLATLKQVIVLPKRTTESKSAIKKNLQKLKMEDILVINKFLLIIVCSLLPRTLVEIKDPSQYGKNQQANGFKRNIKSKN